MYSIYLFVDYRGQFYSSTRRRGSSIDTEKLKSYFKNDGFDLRVLPFTHIDFKNQDYKNAWILYQSSEDPGLFYRSYIEDLIGGLHLQGARLIPSFFLFKSHHNKVFMEILRDLSEINEIHEPKSYTYGTYEDYIQNKAKYENESYVAKTGSTSKSSGVYLLKDDSSKTAIPKKIWNGPRIFTSTKTCMEERIKEYPFHNG
jgi:hypothetical protein